MQEIKALENGNIMVDGEEYAAVAKKVETERNIVIDEAEFERRYGSITTFAKTKETIQDFCKRNRCWAAKDEGFILWFAYKKRPEKTSISNAWVYHDGVLSNEMQKYDLVYPDVPWDKSLVAPDGSMPLMNPKPHKDYSWLKERVPVMTKQGRKGKLGVKRNPETYWIIPTDKYGKFLSGPDGFEFECDIKDLMPTSFRIRKPKRGDPIFVWNTTDEAECPAWVAYFYSKEGGIIYVFCPWVYGSLGGYYSNYRLYDPALVGVPRKDWPKEQ